MKNHVLSNWSIYFTEQLSAYSSINMQLKLASLGLIAAFMTNAIAKPIYESGISGNLQDSGAAAAAAASGLGKALDEIFSKNELGAGVGAGVANSAPAVQDTVSKIQENSGILGDVARTIGGGYARRTYAPDSIETTELEEDEEKDLAEEESATAAAENNESVDSKEEISEDDSEEESSEDTDSEDSNLERRNSIINGLPVVGNVLGGSHSASKASGGILGAL